MRFYALIGWFLVTVFRYLRSLWQRWTVWAKSGRFSFICVPGSNRRKEDSKLLNVLQKEKATWQRYPEHIAVVVNETRKFLDELADLIVWCLLVDVKYLTIYDVEGVLQKYESKLKSRVLSSQHEYLGSMKKTGSPMVIFEESSRKRVNGFYRNESPVLHCAVLGGEDGLPDLVEGIRQIAKSIEKGTLTPGEVSATLLEDSLRGNPHKMEPDLLLVFGSPPCTAGFLPWHIRLTEILCVPTLENLSVKDFYSAMRRFSTIEQRIGK